jgi:SAM-dependent methyltransferase
MTSTDPPFQSIKYLPTTEAYNRWAAVYDTDGNFLQVLDNLEMRTLFPKFEAALEPTAGSRKLVDLGCGTGRNTVQLLGVENASIVALDASPGMLAVTERRLDDLVKAAEGQGAKSLGHRNLKLEVFDLLTCDAPPEIARQADGVISTLVLEHIPLDTFFRHVSQMLKVNGVLLLTNMHGDMGQISQAGFVDTETGEKVRPTSYAHTVESVIDEAKKHGIVAIGGDNTDSSGLMERAVTDEMVQLLGPRSRKWVGIRCWFGGLFKKVGDMDEVE